MVHCGKTSVYDDGLDPLLMQAAGLLVVTMLAKMRWCEYATIREALGLTPAALSSQLAILHRAGYVENGSGDDGRRIGWRLTPLGVAHLTNHLSALQAIVTKAGEIAASVQV